MISSLGGWLRKSFGRKSRPNTMSTVDQPSLSGPSLSPPGPSHSLRGPSLSPPGPSHSLRGPSLSPPGPSLSHEVIIISDDDSDESRGHDLRNKVIN